MEKPYDPVLFQHLYYLGEMSDEFQRLYRTVGTQSANKHYYGVDNSYHSRSVLMVRCLNLVYCAKVYWCRECTRAASTIR